MQHAKFDRVSWGHVADGQQNPIYQFLKHRWFLHPILPFTGRQRHEGLHAPVASRAPITELSDDRSVIGRG